MIEWAIARPRHVQQLFDGLFPDTSIAYGVNGATWTKVHSLPTGVRAHITLTPDNDVRVVIGARIVVRVSPNVVEPLRNGRYAVRLDGGKERWEVYAGMGFEEVVTGLAKYDSTGTDSVRAIAEKQDSQ